MPARAAGLRLRDGRAETRLGARAIRLRAVAPRHAFEDDELRLVHAFAETHHVFAALFQRGQGVVEMPEPQRHLRERRVVLRPAHMRAGALPESDAALQRLVHRCRRLQFAARPREEHPVCDLPKAEPLLAAVGEIFLHPHEHLRRLAAPVVHELPEVPGKGDAVRMAHLFRALHGGVRPRQRFVHAAQHDEREAAPPERARARIERERQSQFADRLAIENCDRLFKRRQRPGEFADVVAVRAARKPALRAERGVAAAHHVVRQFGGDGEVRRGDVKAEQRWRDIQGRAGLTELAVKPQRMPVVSRDLRGRIAAEQRERPGPEQRELDLEMHAPRRVAKRRQQLQATLRLAQRLVARAPFGALLRRARPVFHRLRGASGLGVVVRHQLRLLRARLGKTLLEKLRDLLVVDLPSASEQRLVGLVLDERVAKMKRGVRQCAVPREQARVGEPAKLLAQQRLRERAKGVQHFVRKLAADHRRELRHLAVVRGAVEARHEQRVQRVRDGEPRHAGVATHHAIQFRIEHHAGHFLDEKRHAVRLAHELAHELRRQLAPAGHALDEAHHVRRAEPVQRHLRRAQPRTVELRPRRGQQQYARRQPRLDEQPQRLQRRGIEPVQILHRQHHRTLHRVRGEELRQVPDRALPRRRRRERRKVQPRALGQTEQRGQQRHRFFAGKSELLREAFDFLQPLRRPVLAHKTEPPVQQREHGLQRAVLRARRARQREPMHRLAIQRPPEFLDQPRFADARLAAHQQRLPRPAHRATPRVDEPREFWRAPDERRAPADRRALVDFLDHLIHRHRLGDTFEGFRAERPAADRAAHQPPGVAAEHRGSEAGFVLQPGRDVRHFAHCHRVVVPLAAADFAHHHPPRVQTEAHGQRLMPFAREHHV